MSRAFINSYRKDEKNWNTARFEPASSACGVVVYIHRYIGEKLQQICGAVGGRGRKEGVLPKITLDFVVILTKNKQIIFWS